MTEVLLAALTSDLAGQEVAGATISAVVAHDRGVAARQSDDRAAAAEWFSRALALDPDQRRSRIELATTLRELGRIDEAEAAYQALAAGEPDWFFPLLGLGLCARMRRDLATSIDYLSRAMAAAPQERSARLEYAVTLRELGRFPDAQTVYMALLGDEPECRPALIGLGVCARQRRDFDAALDHIAAALEATPNDRGGLVEYATTLREAGRIAEAEPVYQKLAETAPGWFFPLLGLGLCARSSGNLAAAANYLERAVAAAPHNRSARLEYATLLRELGRTEEAEGVYDALTLIEPEMPFGLVGLGLCARDRGDTNTALRRFTEATATELAQKGGAESAFLELAYEHAAAGNEREARAIYGLLFETGRGSPQAWLSLGRFERTAGNHAAAASVLRRGYEQHPSDHAFLLEIAHDEEASGQIAEAERILEVASEQKATAAIATARLADIARQRQDINSALELAQRAVALLRAPRGISAVGVYIVLAQTLADYGRLDKALAVLDTIEAEGSRHPDVALRRAGLLRRSGRRLEALAVARAAAAAYPRYFPLWYEWFENERHLNFPGIKLCLATAAPFTALDRAHLMHANGVVAEQHWAPEEAERWFMAAIDAAPALAWLYELLARARMLTFRAREAADALREMVRRTAPVLINQGMSASSRETHLGQIIDEFLLDPDLESQLAALQANEPAARIPRFLEMVRLAPDHTPTAIGLLLALRQAGLFDATEAPEPKGTSLIPNQIAQYWEGELPDDVADVMRSWDEHNADYACHRFDAASAAQFIAAHGMPEVQSAFQRTREPAQRADLFRLVWLLCEGGVYVDSDDRGLGPLRDILPPGAQFACYQEEFGTLGNNFLAAAPFHPIIATALRLATEAINRGDNDMIWLATGPGLISRAFAVALATSGIKPRAWLSRSVIRNRHELLNHVGMACALSYKHTRRHWIRSTFARRRRQ